MTSIENIICSIKVDRSNLEHIAQTGNINGSLFISIKKAIEQYYDERKNIPALVISSIQPKTRYCFNCRKESDTIVKGVFSNYKKSNKRLKTLNRHCSECDTIIENTMYLFETIEDELNEKEFLTGQGISWIEQ